MLAGYVAGALQLVERAWWQWLLVVVGAVAIAVPFVRKTNREVRATRLAVDAEARLQVALGDVVTPIADVIGPMAAAGEEERAGLRGRLGQLVVDSLVNLTRADRARAVFFVRDGDRMTAGPWTGRSDAPVTAFVDDPFDVRGTEAFRLLVDRSWVIVDDIDAEVLPAGVEARPGAPYKCFISVAVYAGDTGFGMLTLDALVPNSLTESDLDAARALAHLLGAGLAVGA